MTELEIRLAKLNGTLEADYIALVDSKIREKYSISAELAILRQRDTKPEEFAEYNAYAESCKAEAKAELGMEG
jgi:hypothetical protein